MTSVDRQFTCAMLPPPPLSIVGSLRESLQSYVRRICSVNQIHISTFVSFVLRAGIPGVTNSLSLSSGCAHLISSGSSVSESWISALQGMSENSDYWHLTTREFLSLKGIGPLYLAKYRRWCPMCFDHDIAKSMPFDRLIWTIDSVRTCHLHKCRLFARCQRCGRSNMPWLTARDIPGHCPFCFAWLGGNVEPLQEERDEHSSYLLWTARAYADLLDEPADAGTDGGHGFRLTLERVREFHFQSNMSALASSLDRNKSIVCTWLSGGCAPSWNAVCDVSFAFHLPIRDVLAGSADCVQVSVPRRLPLAALRTKRRTASPVERSTLLAVFSALASGAHPRVRSLAQLARVANVSVREMRRLASAETKAVATLLADRRLAVKSLQDSNRKDALTSALKSIVETICTNGQNPTRRLIESRLWLAGYSIRRNEYRWIMSIRDRVIQGRAG